jgi:hypothetical protein
MQDPVMTFFHRVHAGAIARLVVTALTTSVAFSAAQAASPQVGVSVSINQPGFYGRVDIGDQQPVVIYPQPVIIQQSPVGMRQRPIYLRVPPGHSRNWSRYCSHYRACGQPVYFVRDMPRGDAHEGYREERHDDRRDDRRDWDRHDRHDEGRGRGHDDRGREHGHGRD